MFNEKNYKKFYGGEFMNDLTLFNDLFDNLVGDNYLPTFTYKKQVPKVDVKETDENYTLEMDVPEKTDKDVEIELNNNVLTISSTKNSEKEEKKDDKKSNEKWHLRERTWTQFSRSFSLPDDVDNENISASVKNGVLTVTMPRRQASAAKKIEIHHTD